MPKRISELEYVVPHGDGKGFDKGIGGDGCELVTVLVKVLYYFDDSRASIYVGVHGSSVSCK